MEFLDALFAAGVFIAAVVISVLVLKEFFPMPDTDEENDESPPWF